MLAHLMQMDLIVLFFLLGMLASWMGSDLEVPENVSKFLSIYLLMSLGLKGGHEIRAATDLSGLGPALAVGLASCAVIPAYLIFVLKKVLGPADAAALGASYGSVSAVTFIAARGLLENQNIPFNGYMVAVMAIMEIPAIVVALYLYGLYSRDRNAKEISLGKSVFTAKSVVLLLGGVVIGYLMNEPSYQSLKPVVSDAFKGLLAIFLLDLGVVAQRQLRSAWKFKTWALVIGCLVPIVHGTVGLICASALGLQPGDQVLIAVLIGSASYIAAPTAVRSSIPKANASLYVALPLAMTFPINVVLGIPYYIWLSGIL